MIIMQASSGFWYGYKFFLSLWKHFTLISSRLLRCYTLSTLHCKYVTYSIPLLGRRDLEESFFRWWWQEVVWRIMFRVLPYKTRVVSTWHETLISIGGALNLPPMNLIVIWSVDFGCPRTSKRYFPLILYSVTATCWRLNESDDMMSTPLHDITFLASRRF
jgi:hypothetical protein